MTNLRPCSLRPRAQRLARLVRPSLLLLALFANSVNAQTDTQATDEAPIAEQETAQPAFTPPGKRKAIRGLGSITGRSKLIFPSAPDQAYQLEFTYAFPDRVRWHMAPQVKEVKEVKAPGEGNRRRSQRESLLTRASRRLMYRFGSGAWTIEPGKTTSVPYEGDAYRITLLQFELRRSALIWPGGFEWKAKDQLRRVELEGLGVLEVELDAENGLPLVMRSLDADGTIREELKAIEWQAANADAKLPRAPKSWQLHAGGNHIWTEDFQNLRLGLRYNDSFFQPFDMRKKTRMLSSPDIGVEQVELPEVSVWRQDLTPESKADWSIALEQARAALDMWRPQFEGTEMVLDERPAFLLSADGEPLRLELRLRAVADYPPEKWFSQWGLRALRQARVGIDGLSSSLIKRVSNKAPKTFMVAAPVLVVQLTPKGAGVTQLIIPLISKR